jgi:hypothetical protein
MCRENVARAEDVAGLVGTIPTDLASRLGQVIVPVVGETFTRHLTDRLQAMDAEQAEDDGGEDDEEE